MQKEGTLEGRGDVERWTIQEGDDVGGGHYKGEG